LSAEHEVEFDRRHRRTRSNSRDVGLRVFAVGDDAAILDIANEGLPPRDVVNIKAKNIERTVLDEMRNAY